MGGTIEGGRKARDTNYKLHGKDFYRMIGRKGGRVCCKGGFACEKVGKDGLTGSERAKLAGSIGGARSSRAGVKNGESKKTKKKSFLKKIFGGE